MRTSLLPVRVERSGWCTGPAVHVGCRGFSRHRETPSSRSGDGQPRWRRQRCHVVIGLWIRHQLHRIPYPHRLRRFKRCAGNGSLSTPQPSTGAGSSTTSPASSPIRAPCEPHAARTALAVIERWARRCEGSAQLRPERWVGLRTHLSGGHRRRRGLVSGHDRRSSAGAS